MIEWLWHDSTPLGPTCNRIKRLGCSDTEPHFHNRPSTHPEASSAPQASQKGAGMSDCVPSPSLRVPCHDIALRTSRFPAFRVLPSNHIDTDEPPVKMANLEPLMESLICGGGDLGQHTRIVWDFQTHDGTIANGEWARSLKFTAPNVSQTSIRRWTGFQRDPTGAGRKSVGTRSNKP